VVIELPVVLEYTASCPAATGTVPVKLTPPAEEETYKLKEENHCVVDAAIKSTTLLAGNEINAELVSITVPTGDAFTYILSVLAPLFTIVTLRPTVATGSLTPVPEGVVPTML
jgi:hypothetical protein